MQQEEQELKMLREQIDELDYKIHDLINQRAELALHISKVKVKYHGNNTEFYRPQREKDILNKIKAHNQGPLDETKIAHIFEIIIQTCRQLQIDTHQEKK